MRDRVPERLDRLARQRPAAAVGDRARDHHRQPQRRVSSKHLVDGEQAALAFSVSKMVSTSSRSTPPSIRPRDLLGVGRAHLVEGDGAEGRVVDVGRDRQRAVGRARCAPATKRGLSGVRRGPGVGGRARPAAPRRRSARRRAPPGRSRPGRSPSPLNVLVSMMSAPASRYCAWISSMTSGRVSTSRSLSPLRSLRMVGEALAAEVGLARACGAGSSCPSRRRGRGCGGRGASQGASRSSGTPERKLTGASAAGWQCPDWRVGKGAAGDEHHERDRRCRGAPTATRTWSKPAPSSQPVICGLVEALPAIAELAAHPAFVMGGKSRMSTRPPGRSHPGRFG